MNDPMRYHDWALSLSRIYRGKHHAVAPDDIYQTAMVGLLELWRSKPEAGDGACRNAMRWAVTLHLRRLYRERVEPLEEAETVAVPDESEAQMTLAVVMDRLRELPDREFSVVGLIVMGAHPRGCGLPGRELSQALQMARARIRLWVREASA